MGRSGPPWRFSDCAWTAAEMDFYPQFLPWVVVSPFVGEAGLSGCECRVTAYSEVIRFVV